MGGVKLQHYKGVLILGLLINEDGGADTWVQQIVKTWKQTSNIIGRVTSKS